MEEKETERVFGIGEEGGEGEGGWGQVRVHVPVSSMHFETNDRQMHQSTKIRSSSSLNKFWEQKYEKEREREIE